MRHLVEREPRSEVALGEGEPPLHAGHVGPHESVSEWPARTA
jgi:predicted transcriptional regulator